LAGKLPIALEVNQPGYTIVQVCDEREIGPFIIVCEDEPARTTAAATQLRPKI
jgi:hypothetical protein